MENSAEEDESPREGKPIGNKVLINSVNAFATANHTSSCHLRTFPNEGPLFTANRKQRGTLSFVSTTERSRPLTSPDPLFQRDSLKLSPKYPTLSYVLNDDDSSRNGNFSQLAPDLIQLECGEYYSLPQEEGTYFGSFAWYLLMCFILLYF